MLRPEMSSITHISQQTSAAFLGSGFLLPFSLGCVLSTMRGFPLLVLWALRVAFVSCSGTDRCNSSDACERQDDVPLLQLKKHVESCADELWEAAVATIQHMDPTSSSDLAPRGSPEFIAFFVVLDESLR